MRVFRAVRASCWNAPRWPTESGARRQSCRRRPAPLRNEVMISPRLHPKDTLVLVLARDARIARLWICLSDERFCAAAHHWQWSIATMVRARERPSADQSCGLCRPRRWAFCTPRRLKTPTGRRRSIGPAERQSAPAAGAPRSCSGRTAYGWRPTPEARMCSTIRPDKDGYPDVAPVGVR